jgi:hypothetical protein
MVQFEYNVSRTPCSEAEQTERHCTVTGFAGTMVANSIYHVRDLCLGMMSEPGEYSLKIRNAKETRWLEFGPVVVSPDGGLASLASLKGREVVAATVKTDEWR